MFFKTRFKITQFYGKRVFQPFELGFEWRTTNETIKMAHNHRYFYSILLNKLASRYRRTGREWENERLHRNVHFFPHEYLKCDIWTFPFWNCSFGPGPHHLIGIDNRICHSEIGWRLVKSVFSNRANRAHMLVLERRDASQTDSTLQSMRYGIYYGP
jgi:hypothetical protein